LAIGNAPHHELAQEGGNDCRCQLGLCRREQPNFGRRLFPYSLQALSDLLEFDLSFVDIQTNITDQVGFVRFHDQVIAAEHECVHVRSLVDAIALRRQRLGWRCVVGTAYDFRRESSLHAMHAISSGHWILSPLWLGLEQRQKLQLLRCLLL
jgi:hypothetical protein